MKKRGMSDIFKYILVLVAGISILIFFVSFGVNVSKTLKGVTASDTRETLNDFFNALSTASNLYTPADINSEVYINYPGCGYMAMNIEGTESDAIKYSHIIFSQYKLNKKLQIRTLEWKYPFSAANFFYLVDPSTKIFLVGNSKLVDEMQKDLIKSGVEKTNAASQAFMKEQAGRHKNVIFVFFGGQAAQADIANVKVRSIQANNCEEKDEEEECRGIVNFGDKQAFFAGKAMLYGAIFADDSKNYECGFNMAIKRLKLVSEVYNKKRLLLSRLKPECGKYGFSADIDSSSLESMHSSMLGLKQSNKELGGEDECTKLF